MKYILIFSFFIFSFSAFAQEKQKAPLSAKLQKQKLAELELITDNLSFASKERYLDSLQQAGIIVRKLSLKNSKGCTLEDQENLFRKPQEENIIFLEK